MSGHFLSQQKTWLKDGRTWDMQWGGQEVRSQTDYVLGIDSCLFQNVAVWNARNNTYHYLILGCLRGSAPAAHLRYLRRCTRLYSRPPATPDKADHMFDKLRWAIPRPPQQELPRQAWISPETWSLINTRIEARRRRDQQSSRALIRAIKAGIQGDRHRRADEEGSEGPCNGAARRCAPRLTMSWE